MVMPQEIEVWYLLPAIRKELAKTFVHDHHLTQREVATILGITESAVSQYLKDKRAQVMKFSDDEKQKIHTIAKKMVKDKKNTMKYVMELSTAFRGSATMCDLHRKYDSAVSENCKDCCN